MPWGHFHTAEGPRAAVQLSPQAARWRITSGGVQLGQGIDFLCQEKKCEYHFLCLPRGHWNEWPYQTLTLKLILLSWIACILTLVGWYVQVTVAWFCWLFLHIPLLLDDRSLCLERLDVSLFFCWEHSPLSYITVDHIMSGHAYSWIDDHPIWVYHGYIIRLLIIIAYIILYIPLYPMKYYH
jgi:hypothetical protein